MSFPDAVKTVLSKYADFSGRARRSEYWWFFLFDLLVSLVAAVVDLVIGTASSLGPYGLLQIVASLALFIPGLAVAVRRLHDTDRVGWWLFLGVLPVIGAIILLVWFCTEGHRTPNRFGPDPKGLAGGLDRPGGYGDQQGYGQPGGYGPGSGFGSNDNPYRPR